MKKIKNIMNKENIDMIFLANFTNKDNNIRYLIAQDLDIGYMIITDTESYLYASILEKGGLDKSLLNKKGIKLKELNKRLDMHLEENIKNIYERSKKEILTIGINSTSLSVSAKEVLKKIFKKIRLKSKKKIKLKFTDIGQKLINIRSTKSEREIKTIRKSCSIANSIMEETLTIKNLKKIKTEKDLGIILHKKTIDAGCEPAFDTVVASRKNSAIPHHTSSNALIKKGFLLIDFGVKHQGYHSDMTRTIYIGSPTKKESEHYNLVKDAQIQSIDTIKKDEKCSIPHEFVTKKFDKLNKFFIHSLGHGIGIDIHELPRLAPKSDDIFKDNMAFTIEPGLYFPNKYGIRIEDSLILKNNKTKILTDMTKELIRIKI